MGALRIVFAVLLALVAPLALGADDPLKISAITLATNAAGQQEYSVSLQILLIMTALSFIPAFVTKYNSTRYKYWLLGLGQVSAVAACFVYVVKMHCLSSL